MDDYEAWFKYPHHRNWFNKLWVSNELGYDTGPCGVAPSKSNTYIVRPIYNLSGMSLGAEVKYIEKGDYTSVPPGYFWCEYFEGIHYSASYVFIHEKNPYWKPISCWAGEKDGLRFSKWYRQKEAPKVPRIFNGLSDVDVINIEFIGDKPIEVHLRDTPDPDYDELIPIFKSNKNCIDKYSKLNYKIIPAFDDADGFLKDFRIGFMVRNKNE